MKYIKNLIVSSALIATSSLSQALPGNNYTPHLVPEGIQVVRQGFFIWGDYGDWNCQWDDVIFVPAKHERFQEFYTMAKEAYLHGIAINAHIGGCDYFDGPNAITTAPVIGETMHLRRAK